MVLIMKGAMKMGKKMDVGYFDGKKGLHMKGNSKII